jgi:hypothetical protein
MNFRWAEKIFISLILLLIPMALVQAQAPVMEEQMVYRLRLFDGKGHASSFCPRTEKALYFIADSDNICLPTMTLVYYWPLTRRYKAGLKTLNEPVEGVLEILRGGKVIQEFKPRTYTFSHARQWYAGPSEVLLDEKAKERYAQYQQAVKNYTDQLKRYYEDRREYRRKMEEFVAKAGEPGNSGRTQEQGKKIPVPERPSLPAAPDFYVEDLGQAYIVNLPAGKYEIRIRSSDGTIVEGSERRLNSFTHRRSGKVGYEVASAKRWTMPETSSDPAEIIYLGGKETLYFRPYLETEYNHLYYSKLLDPQNEGYPELWKWVNIKQIEKGTLQLVKDGKIMASVQEKPYQVQQVPGPELGYRIVDYVKEKFPDRGPSLVGYKVAFEPERGSFQIRLLDVSGKVISGSVRELRAIRVGNPIELYLTSVVLPLAMGIPIFIWRRKKLK